MTDIKLWKNARLATCAADQTGLGVINNGALLIRDGQIEFAGPASALTAKMQREANATFDAKNAWILPGFIDCHTHLIFGGDRSLEFERRLEGASYAQLQQCGGGIFGTVAATTAASTQQLVDSTRQRLAIMMQHGVTTVEIKSGYGLYPDAELRMLNVAKTISAGSSATTRSSLIPVPDIISTCLAAHALPEDYSDRREQYIELLVRQLLPEVAKFQLATAVDAFGEHIAFTPDEIETVFKAAKQLGLQVKLHADQLSDQHGAQLAARYNALSADHLEYASKPGVEAMASAGTVAVMLPVAFYTLRETQLPPIQLFRDAGVPMAVATDANPGSSPTLSLNIAMNMACVLFGLTVEEALLGVTRHAARALGLNDRGVLQAGMRADFCVWEIERPAELVYWTGHSQLSTQVQNGQIILSARSR